MQIEFMHPTAAHEAIRGLIDAVALEPDGNQLRIILKGNLAGMLEVASSHQKKAVRNRRPFGPNTVGCGGPQPTVFGVLLDGRLTISGRVEQVVNEDLIRRNPNQRPSG